MPEISQIIQWSEYAMAPLSALAFYFCIRMFGKLIPQWKAARSKWRPPGETAEERASLLYSTTQELISASFMVGKIVLLLSLFILVFAPWWEPIKDSAWRGLIVRVGLDGIIFLMLLHAITRSRYWDRLAQLIPIKPIITLEPAKPWDQITERRKPRG